MWMQWNRKLVKKPKQVFGICIPTVYVPIQRTWGPEVREKEKGFYIIDWQGCKWNGLRYVV